MAVVVEREWVRTWIVAMFDVALGLLLVVVGIMSFILGGSFEHLTYQYIRYATFDVRPIFIIGYATALFIIIYGFKRIIDGILKAWTKTIVKTVK